MSRFIPRTPRGETNVKNPTLTSKGTTLGWGTLEILAGNQGLRPLDTLGGPPVPARNDALKDRLSRYREIKITVTGRKSGHTISIPVWFVVDGGDSGEGER